MFSGLRLSDPIHWHQIYEFFCEAIDHSVMSTAKFGGVCAPPGSRMEPALTETNAEFTLPDTTQTKLSRRVWLCEFAISKRAITVLCTEAWNVLSDRSARYR